MKRFGVMGMALALTLAAWPCQAQALRQSSKETGESTVLKGIEPGSEIADPFETPGSIGTYYGVQSFGVPQTYSPYPTPFWTMSGSPGTALRLTRYGYTTLVDHPSRYNVLFMPEHYGVWSIPEPGSESQPIPSIGVFAPGYGPGLSTFRGY